MVALDWRCATPSRTCRPRSVERRGVHERLANGVIRVIAAVNDIARHDHSARMLKTRGALAVGFGDAAPNRYGPHAQWPMASNGCCNAAWPVETAVISDGDGPSRNQRAGSTTSLTATRSGRLKEPYRVFEASLARHPAALPGITSTLARGWTVSSQPPAPPQAEPFLAARCNSRDHLRAVRSPACWDRPPPPGPGQYQSLLRPR